ncbi:9826_t:CDS:2, partial [Entrophospora sp. SA101]
IQKRKNEVVKLKLDFEIEQFQLANNIKFKELELQQMHLQQKHHLPDNPLEQLYAFSILRMVIGVFLYFLEIIGFPLTKRNLDANCDGEWIPIIVNVDFTLEKPKSGIYFKQPDSNIPNKPNEFYEPNA